MVMILVMDMVILLSNSMEGIGYCSLVMGNPVLGNGCEQWLKAIVMGFESVRIWISQDLDLKD